MLMSLMQKRPVDSSEAAQLPIPFHCYRTVVLKNGVTHYKRLNFLEGCTVSCLLAHVNLAFLEVVDETKQT